GGGRHTFAEAAVIALTEVGGITVAEEQRGERETQQETHLDRSKSERSLAAARHRARVDEGDRPYARDRCRGEKRHRYAMLEEIECEDLLLERATGCDVHEDREADGERGLGPALQHGEVCPAAKEAREPSVGAPHVGVLPARLWHERRDLGIGERSR